MRRVLLAVSFVALPLAIAACPTSGKKADPAAQEACKTSAKDADTCKACCNAAGASGHMFMTGSGCKCL